VAKNRDQGRLDTVIGPETSVKGDFRVAGGVRLDGNVEGRMDVTETLVTGPKSLLKGEVHCRDAVIAGRIEGNVFAAEAVELQTGAQVFGNISCKGLVIQRDCVFHGNCAMATMTEVT
jgi:cytoskeletal protein CcmA (bactofilin family)